MPTVFQNDSVALGPLNVLEMCRLMRLMAWTSVIELDESGAWVSLHHIRAPTDGE